MYPCIIARPGSATDHRPRSHLALSPISFAALAALWHVSAHANGIESPAVASSEKRGKSAPATSFDADALRARGIDPALAAYFSQAPRFTPGAQRVSLFVNDERRGTVVARFDDEGKLCFDRALLDRAGLVVPGAVKRDERAEAGAADKVACYDYRDAFPQTVVELDPGANVVRLIVPSQALKSDAQPVGQYASGGVGGIVNYNLMSMSTVGGSGGRYLLGDGEIGFNAGDWIVRSRSSYSQQGGTSQVSNLYTYAQKTFAGTGAMLQAGEINVSGSLFPVPSIIGAQYFPDSALVPQPAGPSFQGIAGTPARVEVRQLGALIYSTVVPAGPFTLSNLRLTSASADVEIAVTETGGGATRRYTVPVASLSAGQRAPLGLSVAVGKIRNAGSGRAPMVATASKGWCVGSRYRVAGGALVAPEYQAVAAGVDIAVSSGVSGNVTAIASNAQTERAKGASVSASVSAKLTESLAGSVSATQQTQDYRTLSDTASMGATPEGAVFSRFRSQYTASANWSNPSFGGFVLSYSYGSNFRGPITQYATVGWNRGFGRVMASANLQKDLSRRASQNGGVRLFATLSIPLGRANVQGFSSTADGQTRFGASVSQSVNDSLSYNARAETNPRGNGPNLSAGLNVLPRYTQASISYSQSGWSNGSYTAQLQGGVVATREGVTFSPYAVGDTFGVASAGELSGVRISTPQGTVWTDHRGRAVLPVLPAYLRSRVEVLTKSLPRNADLNNGIEFLDAGRGSVSFVDFGIVKARRVLLRVTTPDGKPLPASLPVLDRKNRYVTTSVGDGIVFLNNASASELQVKLDDTSRCRLKYELPTKSDLSRPFDAVNAVCQS
jgi:outer membrane usher protein FimD/PapC